MSLFGIKKAIELAERELNNIEFSNSKEDIRKHGSNVFIMLERVIVELIYVYGYLLYKDNYKLENIRVKGRLFVNDKYELNKCFNEIERLLSI